MSILTSEDIKQAVQWGEIVMEPYDPECVNPNSYDVHLGDTIIEVKPNSFSANELQTEIEFGYYSFFYDVALEPYCKEVFTTKINDVDCFLLKAGCLYLAVTQEYTESHKHVPYLDGKSSIGRTGLFIHVTAGRGDIGFKGYWTLELVPTMNMIVYPGMPIGQITWHTVTSIPPQSYDGNYQKQQAEPVPSKIWKWFKK